MSFSSMIISVVLGILVWLFWKVYLKSRVSLAQARFFLLLSVAVVVFIPFIAFPALREVAPRLLPEISVVQNSLAWVPSSNKAMQFSAKLIIVTGSCVQVVLFIWTYFRIQRYRRKGQKSLISNHRVVVHPDVPSPFVFIRTIFLPHMNRGEMNWVIEHEMAHLKLVHQWDSSFLLIARTLAWWNPLLWTLSKELKLTHEKQADLAVVQSKGNAEEYAQQLVDYAVKGGFAFAHNYSITHQIKERMKNLNAIQKKSTSAMMLSTLFLFMLSFGAIYAQESSALSPIQVDQMPLLAGCEEGDEACFNEKLLEHVVSQIEVPKGVEFTQEPARFWVSFVIDEEGNVGSVELMRSPCADPNSEECAEVKAEISDALTSLPVEKAAVKGGVFVKVEYTVPVVIAMKGEE